VELVPFPVGFLAKVVVLGMAAGIEFEPVDTSLIPSIAGRY